ncbi:MAG TPA: YicC/YloC family endoribonuclease [Candidatus Babeliaceae bacterium]|nr:YicC/YloC family endoribonuclease [Candidatus Babeliaceae bacterium]
MIFSMTGFSSCLVTIPTLSGQELQCTLTLKSLNSRFFEANCKLPHILVSLETELLRIFKRRLYRGNITFSVYLSNPQALKSEIQPSWSTIKGYIDVAKAIQEKFNIKGEISINNLLLLPNVFEILEEPIPQNEFIHATLLKHVDQLIDQLIDVRRQEGLALAQDISERLNIIHEIIQRIEPRAKIVSGQRKDQLMKLLPELSPEAKEQHYIMVYTQLERMDIHEEIVRIQTHLESLSSVLTATSHENGKKIDFILQELFRETNTIASKCNDAEISSLTIAIKVELEKAREQAQNIV